MSRATEREKQELAARIRTAVDASGLSRDLICKNVEIDASRLSKWENAHNSPDTTMLAKLIAALNVDGHWMLTGEGSMHRDPAEEAVRMEAVRLIATGAVSTPTVSAVLKQLQKAQALARLADEAAAAAANSDG